MQKAGTGWLHDAFNSIDGFRMLPIKEFDHFNNLYARRSNDLLRRQKLNRQMAKRLGGVPLISRLKLSRNVRAYVKSGFSTPEYLDLFDDRRNWFTGDITPSYSVLDASGVAQVRKILPEITVFLVVRHPVDRAWSAFNMNQRRRAKKRGHKGLEELKNAIAKETTVDALRKYLESPEILSKSKPSEIEDAWSVYGEKLVVIGMESIVHDQKATIAKLAAHVTGREVSLAEGFSVKNRKAIRAKSSMTEAHRECLFETFADEITIFRKRHPEITEDWQTS